MASSLDELKKEIDGCRKCRLCEGRKNIVFGVGNPNADLMFVGEGPCADEDEQGEPFVGKAGKLMDKAFDGVGIKREDVYIANIVKCRPPKNRDPEEDEASICIDYLNEQIRLVNPKIIVLLGRIALNNILGKEYGITKDRGRWIEKDNILYMPIWHPAALLRDESKKIDFWKDLKEVKEKLELMEKKNG